VNINMEKEPLGHNPNNEPIFLKDIWPTREEINQALMHLSPVMFLKQYENVYEGDGIWQALPVSESRIYQWEDHSTYIKEPPFFKEISLDIPELKDINSARVLALLGDNQHR